MKRIGFTSGCALPAKPLLLLAGLLLSALPGMALAQTDDGETADYFRERPDTVKYFLTIAGAAASGETQHPGESPASLRCAQALRSGVHRRSPAGEPPPRIRDQSP